MKNPSNSKERNLVKGAIRRVFSRSDLRRKIVECAKIEHSDPNRPRVKKWGKCSVCRKIEALYLFEVDHIKSVIPLGKNLTDLTWDELIDRLWCKEDNLQAICPTCHKLKSKAEAAERRRLKKEAKINGK